MDWKTYLIPSLAAAGATLLAGKTLRRLLLLPFELLARKTENKIDDQLVEDAEEDFGLKSLPPPEVENAPPSSK